MSDQPKTLFDILVDFWHARLFILSGLAVGLILAGGFIFTATPYYKSHMLISPASPMNGAEMSSLLADDNLFALRYLAQRVGTANSSDFVRFENTYAGTSVAKILLEDPKITEGLSLDQSFIFSHLYPSAQITWRAERLAEYINRRVRLEPVKGSALRRMTYVHPSKAFGKYFLHNVHRATDGLIRQKIHIETTQRVRYLKEMVRNANNPEHRRALTTLLLEQERLRMLVSIESSYAASVVEPPSSNVKAAWPSRLLVFIGFALVGAFLGFIVHGFRVTMQGSERYFPSPAQWRAWFQPAAPNANQRPLTSKTLKNKKRA